MANDAFAFERAEERLLLRGKVAFKDLSALLTLFAPNAKKIKKNLLNGSGLISSLMTYFEIFSTSFEFSLVHDRYIYYLRTSIYQFNILYFQICESLVHCVACIRSDERKKE